MSKSRSAPAHVRHTNRLNAQRMLGLPPNAAVVLREVAQLIDQGNLRAAEAPLLRVLLQAPEHPETLRWAGTMQLKQGRYRDAGENFRRALAARPEDAVVLCLMATVHAELGEDDAALRTLRAATAFADDAMTWTNLGLEFDRQGYAEDALVAVDRALALAPDHAQARLLHARCLQGLGQPDAAAADYRKLIAQQQHVATAWYALMDQKTVRIDAVELAALERAERVSSGTSEDRTLLAFALGKAHEDAGQYELAFAALARANALARATRPWNPAVFSSQVDAVRDAFSTNSIEADVAQGSEVIFVTGLPRSGTTLIEQVLAAHPQVEGASELPYLYRVIGEESERRGQSFPQWVAATTAADWASMGRRYLQLSARWRTRRPIATDKMPANWLLAGAALAMLPGAKVIGCRRDPIETLWSCYKQLFAPGLVGFAYDFESLAAYWHDYDRLSRFWVQRYPGQFRSQQYEDLVADPEAEIRSLLDFCGLPFDASCLRFHEAQRNVRTASAAQVRQPLRRDTARTSHYGELLEPLRSLVCGIEPMA